MPTWLPWPLTIRWVYILSDHQAGSRGEDADGLRWAGNRSTFFSAIRWSVQKSLLSTFSVSDSAQSYGHTAGKKTKPTTGPQETYALLGELKLIHNAKTKNSSSNWGKKKKKMPSTLYVPETDCNLTFPPLLSLPSNTFYTLQPFRETQYTLA